MMHRLPEAPSDDPILVTAIPEINQIEITDPREKEPAFIEPTAIGQAALQTERLAHAYVELGPGSHGLTDLQRAFGLTAMGAKQYCFRIGEVFPEQVISVLTAPESPTGAYQVNFGNIVLGSRRATEQERTYFQARVDAVGSLALLYKREAIAAIESQKTPMGLSDHIRITHLDRTFVMKIESPDTILGARLLEYVSNNPGDTILENKFMNDVWASLTVTERMAFTQDQKALYDEKLSSLLRNKIDHLLTNLSARMGLTKRQGAYVFISAESIEFVTEALPPEVPYGNDVVRIFPPNTNKEDLRIEQAHKLEPKDIQLAQEYWQLTRLSGKKLGHEAAIALLDNIMSTKGKQALREAMNSPVSSAVIAVISALHEVVRTSLGPTSYEVAFRARTIAGGVAVSKGGGVAQVGGRLPTTTKWFIGDEAQLRKYSTAIKS
jgi:hypothetical protein